MTKILIVEDNEMNRDMLSRRLERKGKTTGLHTIRIIPVPEDKVSSASDLD